MAGLMSFNDESHERLMLRDDAPGDFRLEVDCYSVAAARGAPLCLAWALPCVAATAQLVVLYFLAIARGNIFEDGRWIQPVSTFASVNSTKAISLGIAVVKINTEFQHAQRLYHATRFGAPRRSLRRLCCWAALCLQYVMALAVLVVAMNLVLAAESCVGSIVKTLAVFIVIDMDNLVARFVRNWLPLDFTVPLGAPPRSPAAGVVGEPEKASKHEAVREASPSASGHRVFHVFPLLLLLAELGLAVFCGTLPLTLLVTGRSVSNAAAPVIGVGPLGGQAVAGRATYRVLILAPKGEAPPRLHWVALSQSRDPRLPTSFEVLMGRDGTYNEAYRAGAVTSRAVQAKWWLQVHNFSDDKYQGLVSHQSLYRTMLPYEATFEVTGLHTYGMVFRIFATAQNVATGALAPEALASEPVVVSSRCKDNCRACAPYRPELCTECMPGMRLGRGGVCSPCPANCRTCEVTADRCDRSGCSAGFGWNASRCVSCGVVSCEACDVADEGPSCRLCRRGFGLVRNRSGHFCAECDEHCTECNGDNRSMCAVCREGFVLSGSGSCLPCPVQCRNCSRGGPQSCDSCAPGWGLAPGASKSTRRCSKCAEVVDGCAECAWDEKLRFDCHRCEEGLGISPLGKCEPCGAGCQRCNSAGFCDTCLPGFALTKTEQRCLSCADNCKSCKDAGPALCDVCSSGFVPSNSSRPCVPDEVSESRMLIS